MRDPDITRAPLAGTNLIEASAGTGKTHTIATLFLRLMVEQELEVNQILVVTYTDAATKELRKRIRERLSQALRAFSGVEVEEPFIKTLVDTMDAPLAIQRLDTAIKSFDEAPIFTIHSFCKRALAENAFESGSFFDTELVTDQSRIVREVVEDFWRMRMFLSSPLLARFILGQRFSGRGLPLLEWLPEFAQRCLPHPFLEVVPQATRPPREGLEAEFLAVFQEIREEWRLSRDEVGAILYNDGGLNRSIYALRHIPAWMDRMERFLEEDVPHPHVETGFKRFDSFTRSKVAKGTKKNHNPPQHPFFDLCQSLLDLSQEVCEAFEGQLMELKREFLDHVRQELGRRKRKLNVQGFDDLLINMHQALERDVRKGLHHAIRRRYRAALIDEFQDTDLIQFAIFQQIFAVDSHALFLIGDPKQAIYSFRGADIFAYIQASTQVEKSYTLDINWRSEPGLVEAINALFSAHDNPFVFANIPYRTVKARPEGEILTLEGKAEPAMQIWLVDRASLGEGVRHTAKATIFDKITNAVAGEISRLLHMGQAGEALIGDEPVFPGHMAVLVRTHRQAHLVQRRLASLAIPSVIYQSGNLFHSPEAEEVGRIMEAIIECSNERAIRAALTTTIVGLSGEELDRLDRDEARWDGWLERFAQYHELWARKGFIASFGHLMVKERVRSRLLAMEEGERKLTNVLHLMEVLHGQEQEDELTMASLLLWLQRSMDPSSPGQEEHQLRLESDEDAVKVVTIHKSKGLQYPIVFVPFPFDGAMVDSEEREILSHAEDRGFSILLDLGSDQFEARRAAAEKELLAENMRLLYVAMTRAKNRCYLVWGLIKGADTSAPAYLFHNRGQGEAADMVAQTEHRLTSLCDDEREGEVRGLAELSPAIQVSSLPSLAAKRYTLPTSDREMVCLPFTRHLQRDWRISSFTSLVRAGGERGFDEGLEIRPEAAGEAEELQGVFAFPRGARAGTMLHDLFERLALGHRDQGQLRAMVEERLIWHGLDRSWTETVWQMVSNVLYAELEPGLRLADIPPEEQQSEMEFTFPLRRIDPRRLSEVYQRWGMTLDPRFPRQMGRLRFEPHEGFLMGFMDLVFRHKGRFYLVDWKSNFLGGRVEDYSVEAMSRAMAREYYFLQYHLYCVALERYLAQRMRGYDHERHFGGVFYIFLRGVRPGQDHGVFRDRPDPGFLGELDKLLGG